MRLLGRRTRGTHGGSTSNKIAPSTHEAHNDVHEPSSLNRWILLCAFLAASIAAATVIDFAWSVLDRASVLLKMRRPVTIEKYNVNVVIRVKRPLARVPASDGSHSAVSASVSRTAVL